MGADITLKVSKLLLDEQNPRHRPVPTQESALEEILRRSPSKLLTLARDIAAKGLSPIDRLIVMKSEDDPGKYTVLEGNRRLACLLLLSNPAKCGGATLSERFQTAAHQAAVQTKKVACYEVADREEARPLLERRHGGEMEGAGVVRWSAMQRTRNAQSPAHQERTALITLDWLDGKSAAGANKALADLLDEVAEDKFTTFGRLAGDPDFRAYCGFDLKGDVLTPTDASENVVLRLTLVLEDFAGSRQLSVSDLRKKDDRLAYIKELRERMSGADESDGEPDAPSAEEETDTSETESSADETADSSEEDTSAAKADEEEKRPEPPQPMRLFYGASLTHCSVRVRNILHEVQTIPLNKYPNSAAALIRMVIELAVMEAHKICGWVPKEKDPRLRAFVNNALNELDPSRKAQRYLTLRQELNKKDSLINTETLNAFLHNPSYSPSAPAMRAISDAYSDFLTDLNARVGEAKDK